MPENSNQPVIEYQSIPDNLNVSLLFQAIGKGVQIYVCTAKPNEPFQFEWKLKAPQANLYDDGEDVVAIHYAGPTWQAIDGSKVVGAVVAKVEQDDAIPWLLLRAVSNEGSGLFSEVIYIQRLYTTGGKAPEADCDQTHDQAEILVPYTAQYFFYGPLTE
jgi:hypothetical protein